MASPFAILFSEGVRGDVRAFRAYDRERLLDAIKTQLTCAPIGETGRRTCLRNLVPPFEAVPPIWQLRVGTFRVFYDVDERARAVYVRAIRRKPSHLNTEEIL